MRTEYVSAVFGVSEVVLAVRKRASRTSAKSKDSGSLPLVWIATAIGIAAAMWSKFHVELGHFTLGPVARAVVLALLITGMVVRWWAITVLGRFFTVDVAIHDDHQLVTRGPYAFVRHPSYTGALLACFAIGLSLESWPALGALMVPIVVAISFRIHVEERALAAALGEPWRLYVKRTARLLPLVW